MSIISDGVTSALHAAMNGIEARQKAITANVANLETPGYLARSVDFEDSLRSAIAGGDGDMSGVSATVTESLAPTRLNGNNVNIDFELMAGAENLLRQKLVVQAMNSKYSLLRTAIGS
jgi:flagellar basal-body rod protein FlgB